MRERYKKMFHIPEIGKLPEKVMLARISVSICFILLCLAAMSFSAYAFFSHSVTSGFSVIQSATYTLNIAPPQGMEPAAAYTLDNSEGTAEAKYTFQITAAESSTASVGYARIEITTDSEEVQSYFTKPIWTETDENDPSKVDSREATIIVGAGKSAQVTFIERWGTCAQEDRIVDGEFKLEYVTPPVVQPNPSEEENTGEEQQQDAQDPAGQPTDTPVETPPTQGTDDSADQQQTSSEPHVPDTESENPPVEDSDTTGDTAPSEDAAEEEPTPPETPPTEPTETDDAVVTEPKDEVDTVQE